MRVLLYSEGKKLFSKSGVGIALKHQMSALEKVGVEYTTNEEDRFDVVHINTVGPGAEGFLRKRRSPTFRYLSYTHTTYEDFRNSFTLSNAIAPWLKKRLIKLYSSADFLISPTNMPKSHKELWNRSPQSKPFQMASTIQDFQNKVLAEKFLLENNIRKP